MPRKVVITGMGVLSPIGNSVAEFEFGLKEGHNGIGPIRNFDTTDYSVHIAGEVKINLEEISDGAFFSLAQIQKEISINPAQFTSSFKLLFNQIRDIENVLLYGNEFEGIFK